MLENLKAAVRDLSVFEFETASIYPWAAPPAILVTDPILTRIAAKVAPCANGTYDTDELYHAIDDVAGVNPTLANKN